MKKNSFVQLLIFILPLIAVSCTVKTPPSIAIFKQVHYSMENRNIDPGNVKSLEINEVNGDVKVRLGDNDKIEVVIAKTVKSDTSANAKKFSRELKVITEKRDGTIYIGAEYPNTVGRYFTAEINYEIAIPRSMDIKVVTVNGRTTIDAGAAKSIDSESTNGTIEASFIDGGNAKAKTTNGSLIIDGEIPSANLNTVNGKIKFGTTSAVKNSYNLETVNGSISVSIPKDSGLNVKVDTVNGSIQCDLPMSNKTKKRGLLLGKLNGKSSGHLNVKTINGAVAISDTTK